MKLPFIVKTSLIAIIDGKPSHGIITKTMSGKVDVAGNLPAQYNGKLAIKTFSGDITVHSDIR